MLAIIDHITLVCLSMAFVVKYIPITKARNFAAEEFIAKYCTMLASGIIYFIAGVYKVLTLIFGVATAIAFGGPKEAMWARVKYMAFGIEWLEAEDDEEAMAERKVTFQFCDEGSKVTFYLCDEDAESICDIEIKMTPEEEGKVVNYPLRRVAKNMDLAAAFNNPDGINTLTHPVRDRIGSLDSTASTSSSDSEPCTPSTDVRILFDAPEIWNTEDITKDEIEGK